MRPPRLRDRLPTIVTLGLVAAGLAYGPIAQWDDYHAFADRSVWLGIPHAGDVLSNLGFALVALWGLARLSVARLGDGRAGYRLFLASLLLTAFGSAWYHWAPDDARLVWDRLPIALASAGLLAAVRGETRQREATVACFALAVGAVASVAWWVVTGTGGRGDLRPYLLIQLAPLILVPLWQWNGGAPRADRIAFGAALLTYALAKWAELNDRPIAEAMQGIAPLSGHTLKHLLAAAAAAIIVGRLIAREHQPRRSFGAD